MITIWNQGLFGPNPLTSAYMIAPLDTTIVLNRGDGPATYTRASVAYDVDWEGLLKSVLSGEARFYGARRVQNLAPTAVSAWNTISGSMSIASGVSDPLGGNNAYTLTAGAASQFAAHVLSQATGSQLRSSIWIRRRNGSGNILIYNGADTNGTTNLTATITSSWQRLATAVQTAAGAGANTVGVQISTSADSVDIFQAQFENVTGQSNQNPSEYVSVGVLSTPFQGSGVDGVQYFGYQNGNTVSSNVVTEAQGAAIASATLRGFWREAAATQLVTPTASIRDMTNAAWVKTSVTVALTSTGADGSPNSATRCTASGANGTVIQTLVAAATSRTYSARIRRVTGTGNIELTQDGATFTNIAGSLNSSTYTLVQLNATQLNATFGIRIVTNGDAIDVDFNQFEAGAYATSPMATAGAARAADSLTYPGSNVDVTQGWAYAEVQLPTGFPTATDAYYIGTDAANAGEPLAKIGAQATTTISVLDGTTVVIKTGLPDATAQVVKVASRWGAASMSVTGNGLAAATGAFDGGMGNGSIITILNGGAVNAPTNGTIKNARIGKFPIVDAQLQAMTA